MQQIYHIKVFTPIVKSCVNFAPSNERSRLTQISQAWEINFLKKTKKARLIEQLSLENTLYQ